MLDTLEATARRTAPAVDYWAVRGVTERSERLSVRQDVAEPISRSLDNGLMVTVMDRGGLGYAATSDSSDAGLQRAFTRARSLAHAVGGRSVMPGADFTMPAGRGSYRSRVERPVDRLSVRDRLGLLADASRSLHIDPRIVDWSASLQLVSTRSLFVTGHGGCAEQEWQFVTPNLQATATAGGVTQVRTSAGQYNGYCQQGGLEVIGRGRLMEDGARVAEEAIALTSAPHCPTGEMDLLLLPDQMMLQIHESIGHPLELDRILGDERNFAGTSFVTPDMFGSYTYGSPVLNVTYDPTRTEEFATFAFDDEGSPAERAFIIERGILKRPLGGAVSIERARPDHPHLEGVATTRACSWNRPPIDRMSNLNLEPGQSSLAEMIASVERGVVMRTNCSWSIDDSRNKFQFGCEHGQVIRDGQLAEVVRTPNYRGISATFWRSLRMVGDASTLEVMGTPYCGKGEPGQIIRVGHASPACLFGPVAVFGGEGK